MIVNGIVPTDYPDIATGINSLIASGNADPDIKGFYLQVNSGYYSESFDAHVPNSGEFYIIGDGTYFEPAATCNITTDSADGNFIFKNISIIGDSLTDPLFNLSGVSSLTFQGSTIIAAASVATHISGTITIDNSIVAGLGSGIGFSGYQIYITESNLSNFSSGVYSELVTLNDSTTLGCDVGFCLISGGNFYASESTINDCDIGIYKHEDCYLVLEHSTLNSTTCISGLSRGDLYINASILTSSGYCINSPIATGVFTDSILFPTGYFAGAIVNAPVQTNVQSINPLYNDINVGDLRLKFDYVNGSPAINYISANYPADVTLRIETSNIGFKNSVGNVLDESYYNFLYKQGTTLLYSDYNKEVEHALFMNQNAPTSYMINTQASFDSYEQNIKSCFNSNGEHDYPYDWNLKTIESPEIVTSPSDLQYIIPKTYIDITPIVINKLSPIFSSDLIRFDLLTQANIKVYNKEDARGISFDQYLTEPGTSYIWVIEGRNQLLLKQNAYSGETLKTYPLLCPDMENSLINVSGLIYMGIYENKHRFIDQSDPNKSYIGETSSAKFKWLDTTLNASFDARGVLVYKNNIFITGTTYSEDIYDRTNIPQGSGLGHLLRYSNNHKHDHYIRSYDTMGSDVFSLHSDNYLPTDLTIYENGKIIIADYLHTDKLFTYRLAHDYAIVEESYDKDSRVVLREYYPDITF